MVMIARLEVTRGALTEYPLAEKVSGGWQNGVTFYPDADVTKVTPLVVCTEPTDDEREVLMRVLANARANDDFDLGEFIGDGPLADALIAAGFGFRRPASPDDYEAGYAEGFHHGRSTPAEPQTEPTDAQVELFVKAINAEGFVLARRAVRAGLRAAAAVTEGENR